ncbi:MAG: hypothetical protein MUF15_06510 [Acidobacteria bacterium]|nr:hypothetical protein [Acidobacteriota bacterium]
MKKDNLIIKVFIWGIILISFAFSLLMQYPLQSELKKQNQTQYFQGQLKVVDSQTGKAWNINNIILPSTVEITGNGKFITIPINEDGTFKTKEIIPPAYYNIICKLQYYDHIPFCNDDAWGGEPAPANGKIVRQALRKMSYVKIDQLNPVLDIEFPLPIFLIHGVRCGWSSWHTWANDFLNQGYIIYTPNHDFQEINKKGEADQVAAQFFADLDYTYDSKHLALFKDKYPDVYFICHSEGGIALRVLVNNYPNIKNRIKLIFTLGTPHSGSDIPFASLFGLDKRNMVYSFNKKYPTFNGVPVYAISGHGMTSPYIDFIASPHDGIVYWNDYAMVNKSTFSICNTNDPQGMFLSTTENFAGYSNFYTDNGHHFPFKHSNLVDNEGGSLLRENIIDIMTDNVTNKDAQQNNFNYSQNAQPSQENLLTGTFSLPRLATKRFLVNVSTADTFIVNAMGIKSNIALILIDPDGKTISKDNYGSYASASYSSDIMTGIGYHIATPKPGQWTIEVTSGNVDDTIALGASLKSNWVFLGYAD